MRREGGKEAHVFKGTICVRINFLLSISEYHRVETAELPPFSTASTSGSSRKCTFTNQVAKFKQGVSS